MGKLQTLNQKLRKQGGFVVTGELLLITVILTIGLIVGLVNVRDAANAELSDVAEAFGALDQSYQINGIQNSQNSAAIAFQSWSDDNDGNSGDDITWTYTNASAASLGTNINAEATPNGDGDSTALGVINSNP
jgi:hypothetical protein